MNLITTAAAINGRHSNHAGPYIYITIKKQGYRMCLQLGKNKLAWEVTEFHITNVLIAIKVFSVVSYIQTHKEEPQK